MWRVEECQIEIQTLYKWILLLQLSTLQDIEVWIMSRYVRKQVKYDFFF
jgi:hypothetical protein